MNDIDPTASHDLTNGMDWIGSDHSRGFALTVGWKQDGPGEHYLHVQLDIYPEGGDRISEDSEGGYGLANLMADALRRTRPLSNPLPTFQRIVIGNRHPLDSKGRPNHHTKNKEFEALNVPRCDPCEEGEG